MESLKKQGKDIETVKADKAKATGRYYRLMIDHVENVLKDIKRVYPDYDAKQGYEIAGFVWFQGWNDMCRWSAPIPNGTSRADTTEYSELMAHFIRDVRKDLSAPKMPFVIGVIGVGGDERNRRHSQSCDRPWRRRRRLPEFKGNVAAVQTAPYWDEALAAIAAKFKKPKGLAHHLRNGGLPGKVAADRYPLAYAMRKEYWDTAPKDRKMTKEQQQAYVNEYRDKLITPEDEALWKRGASNAGYHYLGCAKTMALIGKAFAEANLKMERSQ